METTAALYDVKEGFIVFDKNKDGLITADEICAVFNEMEMPISTQDSRDLIHEFDLDGRYWYIHCDLIREFDLDGTY
ncbi:hypothetical protein Btru_075884 [Bulinus truncatus]|nr:hypothetical protein Btru_075884 [Bulinus truncatus]